MDEEPPEEEELADDGTASEPPLPDNPCELLPGPPGCDWLGVPLSEPGVVLLAGPPDPDGLPPLGVVLWDVPLLRAELAADPVDEAELGGPADDTELDGRADNERDWDWERAAELCDNDEDAEPLELDDNGLGPPEEETLWLDFEPAELDAGGCDPDEDKPPLEVPRLTLGGPALLLARLSEDALERELSLEADGPLERLPLLKLCDESELSLPELASLSLTDDQDLAEPTLIWDRHY